MTIAETRANAKRNMWIFSLTQLILFKVWEFWFPRDENRFLAVSVPFVFLLVFAFLTFGWKYTEHHNASYTTECYDKCGMKFPKHLSGQTFNQSERQLVLNLVPGHHQGVRWSRLGLSDISSVGGRISVDCHRRAHGRDTYVHVRSIGLLVRRRGFALTRHTDAVRTSEEGGERGLRLEE